jgi:DNA repair exonuclease SbcCD ATPase subunit
LIPTFKEREVERMKVEEQERLAKLAEEESTPVQITEPVAVVAPPCTRCDDYDALAADRARLQNVVHGLEAEVQDARRLVQDSQQVAASVASDQLAASRALAQNRALKKQLDELQDAFVKMSHSKMAAAEEAAGAHHRASELTSKVYLLNYTIFWSQIRR